ncbi:chloramphenicol acetyltransferase-like domain-containing protein [Tanacetum coccineum]
MGSENSFQIKSLKAEHRCARNYNLGSLVIYKWIAHQFAKDIITDPFITLLKMKAAIREKFLINVSLGQCKRAKQRALFDYEGGLIEHYGRMWEYMQAVLDTNPGSTCILEEEEIEHGELLTAVGKDADNQMYPIAWAVVRVENNLNWSWFLSLLQEDLKLGHGVGLIIISDSHKGLLDVVSDWLPNAEQKKCTRHVYANFKKMYSGVHLQRLFWSAATTTVEHHFYNKMEQIKAIHPEAHDYLVRDETDQSIGGRGTGRVGRGRGRGRNGGRGACRVGKGRGWGGGVEMPGWRLTVEEHVDEAHTTPNAKGKEVDTSATPEPPKMNKQGRKRKQPDASDYVLIMIYYNNRGRSERIFNQKMKKSGLGPNGEGLAQNSAYGANHIKVPVGVCDKEHSKLDATELIMEKMQSTKDVRETSHHSKMTKKQGHFRYFRSLDGVQLFWFPENTKEAAKAGLVRAFTSKGTCYRSNGSVTHFLFALETNEDGERQRRTTTSEAARTKFTGNLSCPKESRLLP